MGFGHVEGYKTIRIAASAAMESGRPIRLHAVGFLSSGTAGVTSWYEDTDAVTAANKRGGATGIVSSWIWERGLNQLLTTSWFAIDGNVSEAMIVYVPVQQEA